jgi:hypothetical protein
MSSGSQASLETPGQISIRSGRSSTTGAPNRLIRTSAARARSVYDLPRNVEAINSILDAESLADSLQLSTLPI